MASFSNEGAGGESSDPRRATQSRERKDFFALKPTAQGEIAGEIDKFVAFAEGQGSVRLDVAKTINSNAPVQFWIGVQHPF